MISSTSALSIASLYRVCIQSFDRLCGLLQTPNCEFSGQISLLALQDELGRFRVWAGNVGAHRHGRVSLDHKLREASQVHKEVVELLKDLDGAIKEAIAIVSHERRPFDELSQSSNSSNSSLEDGSAEELEGDISSTTELQERFLQIIHVITCLYKFSVVIRNPAPHDRLLKCASIDVSHYEFFDIQHTSDKFPKTKKYLADRLGKANSRRRQLIKYYEKHHNKLAHGIDHPQPMETPSSPRPNQNEIVDGRQESREINAGNQDTQDSRSYTIKDRSTIATTMISHTTISTYVQRPSNTIVEVCSDDGKSQTSYATSVNEDAASKLRVPPPPNPDSAFHGDPFECPYCFSIVVVHDSRTWMKHVFRDLRPYVCTFRNCPQPDRLFDSRNDWYSHEAEVHRKEWFCNACQQPFPTDLLFKDHLRQNHFDVFTETQMPAVADRCERALESEQACPLCEEIYLPHRLQRHIAGHMQQLALFILPRLIEETSDDGESARPQASESDGEKISRGSTASIETQSTAQALWEQAIDKLNPEDLQYIDLRRDKDHILGELLRVAGQKKKDCEGKEWSYRDRHGEQKLARESMSNFLVNLNEQLPLGDTAINQQPPIVLAVWGVFKLLLEFVTAGSINLRIIFESLDSLTRILSHCDIYEELYIQNDLEAAPLLQDSLLVLFVSILEYLCYVGRDLRYMTSAQWSQGDREGIWMGLDESLQKVVAAEVGVVKMTDLAAKECQNERLKELVKPLVKGGIERTVTGIDAFTEGEERTRALGWLSAVTFRRHHEYISSSRLPQTGDWLIQKPYFRVWKDSNSSLLLRLHGIVGSGKTMLVSRVIDEMKRESEESCLAYFYCNNNEVERRDPKSILRSLIKQLCLQSPGESLPDPVLAIYRRRVKEADLANLLSIDEIKFLLVELSAGFLTTTIVIDALDECDKGTGTMLSHVLEYVMSSSKIPVKVFITSRGRKQLRKNFENNLYVYIQESDNSGDISNYIDSEIDACIKGGKLLRGYVDDDLRAHVVEALRKGARGMFLWAKHQIRGICGEVTRNGIEKALTELPAGLHEIYSGILGGITTGNPQSSILASRVFKWILYAIRPLSPSELIEVISAEPMTSKLDTGVITIFFILDICRNLVVLDEELKVFRFIHFSVQEFLQSQFRPEEFHTQAAEVCLTMLTQHYATLTPQIPALINYAIPNWAAHVRLSGSGSETLRTQWAGFLKPCPAYEGWVSRISGSPWRVRDLEPVESGTLEPLIVACFYQLSDIFEYLLNAGADINSYNWARRTSLHLAAISGNEHAARLLINKGADPDTRDNDGRTPLSWAAENGHEKVVQMLLEKGVDADSKDTSYGRTPLSWAAEKGHEKVVQMLLEKGVYVDSKDKRGGRTPLSWAAEKGREKVVKMLLEKEVDVDSRDTSCGRTPLSWAAEKGHENVVQMLLEKGTDVNSKDGIYSQTPLSRAAEKGHEKVVQMLLDRGADPNTRDNDGRTPLSWAAENGHEKVVQMLLEKGANADSKDTPHGLTPLSRAAEKGHEKVVQMLLENGVDADSKDTSYGRTALSRAAENGHEKVVQMLLDNGVDVDSKDGMYGQTPLSWAAENGQEKVVQMLLERDAVADSKDASYGRTPLSRAAENGHEKVVQIFLEKRLAVDINIIDKEGQSPLSRARASRREKVVQMLLERGGMDVDSKGKLV